MSSRAADELAPTGKPCVAGNIIRAACISPAAKKVIDKYVPSSPTGVLVIQAPAAPFKLPSTWCGSRSLA